MLLLRIYLLLLTTIFISCSSLKKVEHNDRQVDLTTNNLSLLDGEYEIFANDTAKVSLDQALTFKKYWWFDFDEMKNYQLYLKAMDERHIQVSVYKNKTLLANKTIKVKVIEGNIMIKKIKILPYIIVNGFGTMKTRLTLLEDGNLLIDHNNSTIVTVIILPAAGEEVRCNRLEFKRKIASQ